MDLSEALATAYRTWAQTGHSDVPGFDPAGHDPGLLANTLADLRAVGDRCVVARIQAAWLERVTT